MKAKIYSNTRMLLSVLLIMVELAPLKAAVVTIDENGNLSDGLKVARLDTGEGKVILKIGTIDEICKAFGISRPISDLAVESIISHKFNTTVTVSDKITDRLGDENVILL